MKFVAAIACALLAVSFGNTPALAQKYPDRPITWIVPFGPGTVTDNYARVVSKVLGEKIGQPILIENKPGAGGIVGTEFVMNAKPDGYTFLYGSSGPMATYSSLYKKLSYSVQKSFTPVHGMVAAPLIMVVNSDSPFKTVKDFVDYAKANPDKLNFGTSGTGTAQHLTGELLQIAAGFKMTHIPYKAGASQLADLLAGNIQVMFEYSATLKAHIDSGKLRPLGITSAQRLKNMSNVPTFVEQGLPNVQISSWAVIMMPAGVPADVVQKFADAFAEAMKDPAVVAYVDTTDGVSLAHIGPKDMPGFLESETVKFTRLVEKSGARAD
jgi:tripartite-type tricarboxylate transporter receptor subunit TctC